MRIGIIGGGGREVALANALYNTGRRIREVTHVYGIGRSVAGGYFAGFAPLDPMDDVAIAAFVASKGIDAVVVGSEVPLCNGIVDRLTARGIPAVGPTATAAQLEGSKAFSAWLCEKYRIPAAVSIVCTTPDEVYAATVQLRRRFRVMPVIKADGLAAGKGVFLPSNMHGVRTAVRRLMDEQPGGKIVVQQRLAGCEFSFHVFTDGRVAIKFGSVMDYKRERDGDAGENTGGTGAVSPVPFMTSELEDQVMSEIAIPTITAMAAEGAHYRGVLYVGGMLTENGPKVLEFNVRLGDPEAQVLLPRLDQVHGASLAELLLATTKDGELEKLNVRLRPEAAVCVVMMSAGYPKAPKKGDPISGLSTFVDDTEIFHAGTKLADDRRTFLTDGGRILDVVGFGQTVEEARTRAYARVGTITWDGEHHRHDIAAGF